jgi:2-polyprenyl-6-methoxyphenol hydroxylase-like FAD-dependent oxidoreductase
MDTEILIVGAGPTGLLLAGDLARAGVDVTVVDRHPGESPLTRAFAVHARTLEMLDARGCADAVIATGTPLSKFRLLGSIDADLSVLPSRYNYVLITPQYNVGNVLARRAADLGVTIRRPVDVVGLTHHGPTSDVTASDGVTVRIREGLGSEDTISARWVVGADGHHSTVRRAVGIDFPGESIVQSLVLADVRMTEPPADVLTTNGNRHGFCFVVPFGDGWYRVITRDQSVDLPDTAPVELEEVRRTARAVFGTDFGMHDPRWLSRFHSEERQATAYRRGRVLLAGDAAHVHSPAGGMGMNTGLQDAANLGWKLAAVANGWAHEDLLDSYEANVTRSASSRSRSAAASCAGARPAPHCHGPCAGSRCAGCSPCLPCGTRRSGWSAAWGCGTTRQWAPHGTRACGRSPYPASTATSSPWHCAADASSWSCRRSPPPTS